jgi:hypothetical protein
MPTTKPKNGTPDEQEMSAVLKIENSYDKNTHLYTTTLNMSDEGFVVSVPLFESLQKQEYSFDTKNAINQAKYIQYKNDGNKKLTLIYQESAKNAVDTAVDALRKDVMRRGVSAPKPPDPSSSSSSTSSQNRPSNQT